MANSTELWRLGAVELAAQIRALRLSPVELVESLLDRIQAVEPGVKAWVVVDGERALTAAKQVERDLRAGKAARPVAGIPLGVKDIFHAEGLPTLCGSRSRPRTNEMTDSAAVANWRRAGGIVLGKMHTSEFADNDPPPTRNAWHPEHTPGGSSGGSGAAVGAGMVPVALGSQTGGSTLRPAAYNGVVGFKPTFGLISGYGMIPHSWSLDTVGIITRTTADAALSLEVLAGFDERDPDSIRLPGTLFGRILDKPIDRPRLGIPKQYYLDNCTPETKAHVQGVIEKLARAGADIQEFDFPASFSRIHEEYLVLCNAEVAAYHAEPFARASELYGRNVAARIRDGQAIPALRYAQAVRARGEIIKECAAAIAPFDAILTPGIPAPAPDLATTGDPLFQRPWSYCGFPAIALPSGLASSGLPLAIQLVALPRRDPDLLRVAAWCEKVIDFRDQPASWGTASDALTTA